MWFLAINPWLLKKKKKTYGLDIFTNTDKELGDKREIQMALVKKGLVNFLRTGLNSSDFSKFNN